MCFSRCVGGILAALHIVSVHYFIVQGGRGFDHSVDMRNKVCVITGANTGRASERCFATPDSFVSAELAASPVS